MKRIIDRAGWALAGALALMLVLVAARAIQAGPLDPPGPVASTMKTLDEIPPSWDQILSSTNNADFCNTTRFKCVMGGTAVLDHETGLVWQRVPSGSDQTWASAMEVCIFEETGGRLGWRIPTIEELLSLRDTSADYVPDGWPFTLSSPDFWSSTTLPGDPGGAYAADFVSGNIYLVGKSEGQPSAWCVRGGYGHDGY